MTTKENIEQLKSLIEHFNNGGNDFNATDIEAIKFLLKENQELKKQVEENKDNYNCLLKQKEQFEYIMSKQVDYQGQQKEFIKYLEDEKDRLARECSQIYEDGLGHTRLINEDIFNEVNDISQKYKEIIGVSDDNKTTI